MTQPIEFTKCVACGTLLLPAAPHCVRCGRPTSAQRTNPPGGEPAKADRVEDKPESTPEMPAVPAGEGESAAAPGATDAPSETNQAAAAGQPAAAVLEADTSEQPASTPRTRRRSRKRRMAEPNHATEPGPAVEPVAPAEANVESSQPAEPPDPPASPGRPAGPPPPSAVIPRPPFVPPGAPWPPVRPLNPGRFVIPQQPWPPGAGAPGSQSVPGRRPIIPGRIPPPGFMAPHMAPAELTAPTEKGFIHKDPGVHGVVLPAILGALVFGAGQMVNRQFVKGWSLLVGGYCAAGLAYLGCRLAGPSGVIVSLLVAFAYEAFTVADAIGIARRLNRGEGVMDWQWF